jgi:hypothetical protein
MRIALALISTALGIVNAACTMFDAPPAVRIWLSIGAVAFLLLYFSIAALASPEQSVAWRVSRYCKQVKKGATRTIDIAAGDCSWLDEEKTIFIEAMAKGVAVRLLVERVATQSPGSQATLKAIAGSNSAKFQVRVIPRKSKKLRCIVIDQESPASTRLLFQKKPPSGATADWPFIKPFRRNQTMFVIPSDSQLYEWTKDRFEDEWKKAEDWQKLSPEEKA